MVLQYLLRTANCSRTISADRDTERYCLTYPATPPPDALFVGSRNCSHHPLVAAGVTRVRKLTGLVFPAYLNGCLEEFRQIVLDKYHDHLLPKAWMKHGCSI